MGEKVKRKLVLEDGSIYEGYGFGCLDTKFLELVFNTSMAGYQEILTDPSYTDQAVVMTYPLIGNYGINDDDYETLTPGIGALIVRKYTEQPSNFRSTLSLGDFMEKNKIAGIEGIDTRELTRKIRNYGSCKVMIADSTVDDSECISQLGKWDYAHDQVERATTKKIWVSEPGTTNDVLGKVAKAENSIGDGLHIVAIDCGMKLNIVRSFNRLGCKVTVVPYDTDADEITKLNPDGVFLSNGPGNPEDVVPTITAIKKLKGKFPIFGICLGHQMLSLAYGAKTYKLKFGHRGGNHPVKNIYTDKIEITSQNHSYAVDLDSLNGTGLVATHINMLDNTVEGLCCVKDRAFSIQYHPESAPGPEDSEYLFNQFIDVIKGGTINA